MDIAGSRIWVTGASSGIGAALANELDRRGAKVAISARREDRLTELAQGRMHVQPLDVTDRDAVLAAGDAVRAALGGLDVAVLNAGAWDQVMIDDWDAEVFQRHFDVNLMGMVNCVQAVMPAMIAAKAGMIVGVASVAGYRGMPNSEAYGATKAAQINLLESLRVDLRRRGVMVQTVCPGFVKTEMTERNTFPMPWIMSPEDAAYKMADGIASGRPEVVFPLPMLLLMKTARLIPVRAWAALLSRATKKPSD
ncbi:MAG: SDR family NAD(P)-dependent oxidoreductase [Geodermatophilaceae bacterium]|nr:SDR family NAD(P)-dependent oxidoreductase [Geodermatophilaceae bacterium]